MKPELIREIIALLEGTSVEEIDLRWKDERLHIKRSLVLTPSPEAEEIPQEKLCPKAPPLVEVSSTWVGTFHPLVREGQRVGENEKIGEVEVLGIREEILAPFAGTVDKIMPKEGDIIEYGQILFLIKKEA